MKYPIQSLGGYLLRTVYAENPISENMGAAIFFSR